MSGLSELHELMSLQRQLMERMKVGILSANRTVEILDATLGVTEEAVEIVRELRNHMMPWRIHKVVASSDHVFAESIDVLFYLLELWILWEKTPEDIIAAYKFKWTTNLKRIEAQKK